MMADLRRIKLLFKTKTQIANSNNNEEGDERHMTKVWIDAFIAIKIVDLVGELVQIKEKNQNERGRLGAGSRKRKEILYQVESIITDIQGR